MSNKNDELNLLICEKTLIDENISSITKLFEEEKKNKRVKHNQYVKTYYDKNREKINVLRKEYNKKYSKKYKKRFHCEICDLYMISIPLSKRHFNTIKHSENIKNLENKIVIKNTITGLYII